MVEDRQRSRGRVRVALDIVRGLSGREAELPGDAFDDAQVRLMDEGEVGPSFRQPRTRTTRYARPA